jgi:hypothetical protein
MTPHEEQTERIQNELALALDNLDELSFEEFEELFEDRDPFEFI